MTPWYAAWLPWIIGIVAVHWLVPARWRPTGLALAGGAFLAAIAPPSAVVLAGLSLLAYPLASRPRAHWLPFVALAIGAGFLVVRGAGPLELTPVPDLALLGLAYYVLRVLHYLLEAWKGTLPPHRFHEWLAYMWFPPILPIGPIERFETFLRELRRLHWDERRFAEGLERLLYGYAKVVVVAGYLLDVGLRDASNALAASHPGLFAYVECLRTALALYFRFAGYSDIAIGFALALGVRVQENFQAPFLAGDLLAFWRRWHMSLSGWCRDYVYVPLAAWSRSPALAAIAAMLVVGAWHGAAPRYLAWGLYHGLGLVACRAFQRFRPRWRLWDHPAWRLVAWQLTVQFVVLGFVITNARDLAEVRAFIHVLVGR